MFDGEQNGGGLQRVFEARREESALRRNPYYRSLPIIIFEPEESAPQEGNGSGGEKVVSDYPYTRSPRPPSTTADEEVEPEQDGTLPRVARRLGESFVVLP